VRAEPRGQAELVSGMTTPIGGEDFDAQFGPSLKVGARASYRVLDLGGDRPSALWAEIAVDWTDTEWDIDVPGENRNRDPVYRLRGLAGVRLEHRVAPWLRLYARTLVGFDRLSLSLLVQVPGEPTAASELCGSDLVPALETGLGAALRLGPIDLGVQVGLPIAFYGQADGVELPGSGTRIHYIHETTVELDVLVMLGVRFW
jgi:hypothetical protein